MKKVLLFSAFFVIQPFVLGGCAPAMYLVIQGAGAMMQPKTPAPIQWQGQNPAPAPISSESPTK
jgi:hypothetical protein